MEGTLTKKYRRCVCVSVFGMLFFLLLAVVATVIVDPFFHYHAPLPGLAYKLDNERYQNDGILRHFTYDAIITGTSESRDFRCTQFDALWNATSVKVPLSAGNYCEVDQQLRRAIRINPGIRYVVRGLDKFYLVGSPGDPNHPFGEAYLYDDNLFNDAGYVLNKDVLLLWVVEALKDTADGKAPTSLDDYMGGRNKQEFRGKERVLYLHERYGQPSGEPVHLDEEKRALIVSNLEQNVLRTVRENPDITFYYYITPYSICCWDDAWRDNEVPRLLEEQQVTIETLIPYENLHLFCFDDEFSVITDLDLYHDKIHYSWEVYDWMLACMHSGEHRVTEENWQQYMERIGAFYNTFDYDGYYAALEEEIASAE